MNKKINKSVIINIIMAIVAYGIVMALIYGGFLGRQAMSIIIPCCINVMLAVSLCLLVGFLGELTLGHAGFMSIGAYAGALTTNALNLPPMVDRSFGRRYRCGRVQFDHWSAGTSFEGRLSGDCYPGLW